MFFLNIEDFDIEGYSTCRYLRNSKLHFLGKTTILNIEWEQDRNHFHYFHPFEKQVGILRLNHPLLSSTYYKVFVYQLSPKKNNWELI